MTVDSVRARLAALQALVTGVNHVYAKVPRAILEAELPVFYTLVGRARYSKELMGEQVRVETRTYTMRLLVKTATLGIEGEAEEDVTPFFEAVRDVFDKRPQLQLNATSSVVYNAVLTGDSGVIAVAYPQNKFYMGTDFSLDVTEVFVIDYT